jgi:hypothetical protein
MGEGVRHHRCSNIINPTKGRAAFAVEIKYVAIEINEKLQE